MRAEIVLLVLALPCLSAGHLLPQRQATLLREVSASGDIAWLERLALDPAFAAAEYLDRGRPVGTAKAARSYAYMRLGELGTTASLAAVRRIEKTLRGRSTLPPPVVLESVLHHPAAHMGDSRWHPVAQVQAPDGREYVAFRLDFYGARSLFIAWREGNRPWSRPVYVPVEMSMNDVVLTAPSAGVLRATFTANPQDRKPVVPPLQDLNIADIQTDTDRDGWTDAEEAHLGLNPRSKDTDADGQPDDRDSTPLFAGTPSSDVEEDQILQRAIFAVFGLTGAPHALFVERKARRLPLYGLPGPIIYTDSDRPLTARRGGVQVSWRVIERGAEVATVEVSDFEGFLAASSEHVTLRRIAGEWYVVKRVMQWIS